MFDWLGDLLGLNKGKATIAAAQQNKDVLGGLANEIGGLIDTGTATQRGFLDQSLGLGSLGPNANGILGDIYGLNGQAGADNARAMFQEAPGYQYALEQGEDAIMRRNSALGNLQSGGTSIDLMRHGVGMADQGWDDWIGGITGAMDRQGGTLGDLATLYGQNTGQKIGLSSAIGSGVMGANNQVAGGKEAGQGAIWDLLGNVAGVAGSAMGYGGGFGGPGTGATGANTYAGGGGFYGIPGFGN